MSTPGLFVTPPTVEFRSRMTHCVDCGCELKVRKTRRRTVITLHIGRFHAREAVLGCEACGRTYRSEELCSLVPPGANFGYDVIIYAGRALFLRHRNEDEAYIVPFLERLKQSFGIPLALVHDMGSGILKTVAKVFPGVADFICHFHFLRDIGKDYMGAEYDTIRKRLRHHGISATLRYRAKQLKREMDANPTLSAAIQRGLQKATLPPRPSPLRLWSVPTR